MIDIEKIAGHPAIAATMIQTLQEEVARLTAKLAISKAMAPEEMRAALAQQPQALEFSADAI